MSISPVLDREPSPTFPRDDSNETTLSTGKSPQKAPTVATHRRRVQRSLINSWDEKANSLAGFDLENQTGPPARPTVPVAQYRVSGLSTWTGRVTEVDDGSFTARLRPDDDPTGAEVLADFASYLVAAEGDELQPGDVIYVSTRLVQTVHGLPAQTSSVRLRRLGKWTVEDVQRYEERAAVRAERLAELAAAAPVIEE